MKRSAACVCVLLWALSARGVAATIDRADGNGAAMPRALPAARRCGAYQRAALDRLASGAPGAPDSLRILVVRAVFADRDSFAVSRGHDSLYFANEVRHLDEYFRGASRGRFHAAGALAPGIVTLARPERYYGDDRFESERAAELLMEVVAALDPDVDFALFDACAVIHAGAGQETDFNGDSPYQLWTSFIDPAEMAELLADTLGTPGVPTGDRRGADTVYVDNLMLWPEEGSQDGQIYGSLGLYAYQVGLRIGMVPLYDGTPGSFPDSQGAGAFDLMSWGLYNAAGFIPAFPSAFNRYLMGWIQPLVPERQASLRLHDVNTPAPLDTALVKVPISSSEYFLIENRVHDKNFNGRFDFIDLNGNRIPENEDTLRGAEFDYFLTSSTNVRPRSDSTVTGSGIYVWHVDEAAIARSLAAGNGPNDDVAWKGVDLEEADGMQDLDRPGGSWAFGSWADSYRLGNAVRFGPDTEPSSASNGGGRTGFELYDISAPDSFMTCRTRSVSAIEYLRAEFEGEAEPLSPVLADIDADGTIDLVAAADTGLVYAGRDVTSTRWRGEIELLADEEGVSWAGPPVLADIDGDDSLEIFATGRSCVLRAYRASGALHPIDVDASPGSLFLPGDRIAAPIAIELDGTPGDEVVVMSSSMTALYLCVIGCDFDWPGSDWQPIGAGLMEFTVSSSGNLLSHPAVGRAEGAGIDKGIYVVTEAGTGRIGLGFIPLIENGSPREDVALGAFIVDGEGNWPRSLLAPAVGDIDRDGIDEAVVSLPGGFLRYFTPFHAKQAVRLRGGRPSPPVLADVDGDGFLDTVLRDEGHLYLLAGFGVQALGWPVAIDERLAEHGGEAGSAPPVVADLDCDGAAEILFRVSVDVEARELDGSPTALWRLPGEGEGGGSPAAARGPYGNIYLFLAGSFSPASLDGIAGSVPPRGISALRRYGPGCFGECAGEWLQWRHDAGGSGRQELPAPPSDSAQKVDPASFICYPSPASGASFTVRVVIRASATVTVEMLDIRGERIERWVGGRSFGSGGDIPFEHRISTAAYASGVYLCRVRVEGDGWSWEGIRKIAIVR